MLEPPDRPLANLPDAGRVAVARSVAKSRMPYFSRGLMSLVPRSAPGQGTFAVTKEGIWLVDYDIIGKMTPSEAATETLHEYFHIFFNHAERFERMVQLGQLRKTAQDHDLWNRCADAELNDNIVAAGLKFSKILGEPVLPENLIPGQPLPDHHTAEWYLKKCLEARKAGKPEPQPGRCCGSAAGNPAPGEPAPGEGGGRSEVELHVTRTAGAREIKAALGKSQGLTPEVWDRTLDDLLGQSKVPWQTKLSMAGQNAVSAYQAGMSDYTYSQPSRWAGAFGDAEWTPVLPSMHSPIAQVVVVIDTSGSMTNGVLRAMVNETAAILRALAGATITFIACDAKVHSFVQTRDLSEIRKAVKGGGGTNFTPAFDAIAEMNPQPDLIVFGTDGHGRYPTEPPPQKVIWLNTGKIKVDWGEVIDIDPADIAAE